MRNKTFKKRTILHAWEKAGLHKNGEIRINPETVLKQLSDQFSEPIQESVNVVAPPVTPPRRPFQDPPTSANRAAHSHYLDQRLDDAFDNDEPLTPSFAESLRAYKKDIDSKLITASLIKQREEERIEAAKEQARRKSGSGRHVQKGGVIYKHVGLQQVEALETMLADINTNRDNKAEKRAAKAYDKAFLKAWKSVLKAIPKEVEATTFRQQSQSYYQLKIKFELRKRQDLEADGSQLGSLLDD